MRYCHPDSSTNTRPAIDFHIPAMKLCNVLHYGKAKPGTARFLGAGFIHAVKPLKDMAQVLFWDAYSAVLNNYNGLCIIGGKGYRYTSAVPVVFDCVSSLYSGFGHIFAMNTAVNMPMGTPMSIAPAVT